MAKVDELALQVAQNPSPSKIQDQLSALLLKKMLKEEQAEEESAHQREVGRQQMLKQIAQAEAEKEAERANCSHRKPDGRSCIGGQRDSNQKLHLICLYCQKEFDNVPAGHTIERSAIGGPQV